MLKSHSIINLLLAVSLLSLVSLGFGMGFMSHSDGSMDGCPFAGGQISMCPMTLNSHVAHWLESLLAVGKTQSSLVSLLLLSAILVTGFVSVQLIKPPQMERFRHLLFKYNPLGKIYNQFLKLFSSGILHPKIFAA